MLDALVCGTADPAVLAEMSKGRLRSKIPELTEALEGRFDQLHSLLIGSILSNSQDLWIGVSRDLLLAS